MFCMECGTKLPDNAKFCMNCGTPTSRPESGYEENIITPQVVEGESLEADEEDVVEEIIEMSPIEKKPFFLRDYSSIPIHLHDQKGIVQFKPYLRNGEYHFPLGESFVEIPEYLITAINTQVYFMRWVCVEDIDSFEEEYEDSVHDMASFYEKGLRLFEEAQENIARHTLDYYVASGIMTVSEDTVRKLVGMHDPLKAVLDKLFSTADAICERAKTEDEIREMNRSLSGNGYVAGGFGFGGVLGGMAAAGIANAGSNAWQSLKDGLAKSRNHREKQKALDEIFGEPMLLDAFCEDLEQSVSELVRMYQILLTDENTGVSFEAPFDLSIMGEISAMRSNTIKYVADKDEMLENLSRAISCDYMDESALEHIVKTFYADKELLDQVKVICGFLLLDEEFEEWTKEASELEKEAYRKDQEEKRKSLDSVFEMSERTSQDVKKKMDVLRIESERVGYDASDELKSLEEVCKKLEKNEKEAGLNKALNMPEKTVADVLAKIDRVQSEAEKIDYDVQDKISVLEKKCRNLEKEEREASYRQALSLPESSSEEILAKLEKVKSEGEIINYPFEQDVKAIEKRLDEVKKKEAKQRMDELSGDILMEACMNLTKKANRLGIANYFQGIGVVDLSKVEEFDDDEILEKASLFYPEMDYQEEEVPILYYDDTLTKSGKDSMFITDRRLYVAYLGQVDSFDLIEVESLKPVEKLLTPHILVNDRCRIAVGIAGKKYVQPFIELIRMAVMTGIALRPLRDDPDEENLNSIKERLKVIGEMADGKILREEKEIEDTVEEIVDNGADPEVANQRFCPRCGNELKEGSKFCNQCGTPVEENTDAPMQCPQCGNLIKPGKRFCNQCGTRVG